MMNDEMMRLVFTESEYRAIRTSIRTSRYIQVLASCVMSGKMTAKQAKTRLEKWTYGM